MIWYGKKSRFRKNTLCDVDMCDFYVFYWYVIKNPVVSAEEEEEGNLMKRE
jgi:hypothetical protein